MASPITFGGLASGLDTQGIIAALVGVEGRKVDLLRSKSDGFQKKINALDDLQKKMGALETALKKLADPAKFVASKANLPEGASNYLSLTTRSDAKVGTYSVEVIALAQSSFIRSDGFAATDTDLGAVGTLTIDVGGTQFDIDIDGTNNSLNGIRDAINDADVGAVATTVFDGTDWHLELRGAETGVANAVSIVAEPGLPPPQGDVLNLTSLRTATDASFEIDGESYTSSSNTVEDAIQGVTLQLLEAHSPIQFTISEDFASIQQQLQDFVNEYNKVVDFLNDQSKPRASGDDATKPLAGDSSLRSLRSALGTAVGGSSTVVLSGNYPSLATIGISTDSSGKLSLDSTKLSAALADDLNAVSKMVADPTTGVGAKLLEVVEKRTDTVDGAIKTRKDAFRASMDDLARRITRGEDQLVTFEDAMRRRFAAMETLVGRLQAQGGSLGSLGSLSLGNR
ncbi:MAG: flagellar filament capping protein FliD [Planctomycetota bacterium]